METEIAWAAGIFEGEGTVFSHKTRSTDTHRYVRLSLSMADEDIVRRLNAIVPGKLNGPFKTRKDNHRPMWKWQVDRIDQVQEILRLFWPWLGQRRRSQAALALSEYMESR
jgi:hypothetical protein